MKAVRIYGKEDVRVEDIDIADPKPNQVQIKVKDCGICGSDLHAYSVAWGLPTQPHPLTGKTVPITLGHEFSGEVVKVGSAVTDFKVGDGIAVEPLIACGKCANCRSGNYNFCDKVVAEDGAGNFLGFSEDGGMAEYANIDDVFAHHLPEGLDYELGAICEPTSVSFEGIKRSGLRVGQTVAVLGAGPIGLTTAILARIAGAPRVYISDVSDVRLDMARKLGFTDVLNPTKDDVNAVIRKDCPDGVDVSFECGGVQATFDTALQVTRRNGTVQLVALGKPLNVNFTDDVIMQGFTITTTLAYENCFDTVLGIIAANKEQFKPLITKKLGLDDAIEGIKALATDKSQVKVMIDPAL
ncbi:2,3-butanediol dehydrogenase [Bifidobacterium sp. ESL0798]|uniref:2,3-butanediol dehydrogenase n=1 Tax=unclassified Bifidobacterium TaxID=2608897 RepID=UPI0023F7CCA3|nr:MULTISPECIES: 2,3-butanediol dehydrogenase [unclassified Bifidobacterium]WEV52863.1 2,3-butanediol dehydrogenase [Bifidobacterium sp. ESL0704]WEV73896.1 2,3-butanediol dehydrogenase [Bifidobacterium sp. ESL0798]